MSYPKNVKIYIDDRDITLLVFGTDVIELNSTNNKRRNIDVTPFVKTPGRHKLRVVPESGAGRVEARLEIK